MRRMPNEKNWECRCCKMSNLVGYELTQTVAPVGDIVTLQEVKRYLALDGDDDDTLLTGVLIPSAIESIQTAACRQLLTATWQLKLGSFPGRGEYQRLPLGQLQSVEKIDYRNQDGQSIEWSSDEYRVATGDNAMIWPTATDWNWPDTDCRPESVVITFVCGYQTAPDIVRNAVLLQVAHNYERRDSVDVGSYNVVPRTVSHLIGQFSLHDLFEVYTSA